MINISICDNWQIEEQKRQDRMRIKDLKRCSLENDLWKIKQQDDRTKMTDQCINRTE